MEAIDLSLDVNQQPQEFLRLNKQQSHVKVRQLPVPSSEGSAVGNQNKIYRWYNF